MATEQAVHGADGLLVQQGCPVGGGGERGARVGADMSPGPFHQPGGQSGPVLTPRPRAPGPAPILSAGAQPGSAAVGTAHSARTYWLPWGPGPGWRRWSSAEGRKRKQRWQEPGVKGQRGETGVNYHM